MRRLRRILVVVSWYYSLGCEAADESESSSGALSCGAVEYISITMRAMMMMSAAVKLDVCMDGY